MKNLKCILFLIGAILFISLGVKAQFPAGFGWVMPRESPAASVSQTVGVTEITIKYHRPTVRGRTIWGCQTTDVLPKASGNYSCLVPNGQVWRAGANDATTISFSTTVKIEGQPLKAGTYGLFMIPSGKDWTIIFSKTWRQWGSFTYKEADDALRVTVTPQSGDQQERLEYEFPVASNDAAQIALRWEKMKIPINVTVDSVAQSSAKAKTIFDPASGYFAADYFLQTKTNLEEGLKWINAALAFDESGGNLILKARILAEMKLYDEAIEVAGKAVAIYKSKNQISSVDYAQKLIDKWKKAK